MKKINKHFEYEEDSGRFLYLFNKKKDFRSAYLWRWFYSGRIGQEIRTVWSNDAVWYRSQRILSDWREYSHLCRWDTAFEIWKPSCTSDGCYCGQFLIFFTFLYMKMFVIMCWIFCKLEHENAKFEKKKGVSKKIRMMFWTNAIWKKPFQLKIQFPGFHLPKCRIAQFLHEF